MTLRSLLLCSRLIYDQSDTTKMTKISSILFAVQLYLLIHLNSIIFKHVYKY